VRRKWDFCDGNAVPLWSTSVQVSGGELTLLLGVIAFIIGRGVINFRL
jgi:hypothetical protein